MDGETPVAVAAGQSGEREVAVEVQVALLHPLLDHLFPALHFKTKWVPGVDAHAYVSREKQGTYTRKLAVAVCLLGGRAIHQNACIYNCAEL